VRSGATQRGDAGYERRTKPSNASGKTLIASVAPLRRDNHRYIMELAASATPRPVIDRVYDLEDSANAHAYVDTGRKRGSVVLTVDPGSPGPTIIAGDQLSSQSSATVFSNPGPVSFGVTDDCTGLHAHLVPELQQLP
jgi:hypothetical protein